MKAQKLLIPACILLMAAPAVANEHMEAISDWSDKQKQTVQEMVDQYGEPDGIMNSRVVWTDPEGDWEEIVVYREEVNHEFPMPHTDYLEQAVYLDVPADKMDELAAYDGSIIVYQTEGRVAARCDKQAANYLALNLAYDIINDEKSVEEARQAYADAIRQMQSGSTPELMRSLTFEPVSAEQAAKPDEALIAGSEEESSGQQTASVSNQDAL